MRKNPNWKQATPRDQFIAIRASILGDLSNIKDGVKIKNALERIEKSVDEIAELLPFLTNPSNW